MWPNEAAYEGGAFGWISRSAVPDAEEAITLAAEALQDYPRERIQLRPVLMREQSEVEAKIAGEEFPLWVQCTKRARQHEPFWRVEVTDG